MHNYVRTHRIALFSENFPHDIHMPPKPIASAGCDTTLFLCKKLTKYTPKLEYILFHFYQNFLEEIYIPPKPLAINHRATLSLFHR